jgi:hypothetical protein
MRLGRAAETLGARQQSVVAPLPGACEARARTYSTSVEKRGADLSGRASNRRTSGAVAPPLHLISEL